MNGHKAKSLRATMKESGEFSKPLYRKMKKVYNTIPRTQRHKI